MSSICLIRPPRITPINAFSAGAPIPPVGLAYIASSLEAANFNVQCIDGLGEALDKCYVLKHDQNVLIQGLNPDEIVSRVPSDVKLIGVSCMFSSDWVIYEAVIKTVKKHFPNAIVVAGGEHITAEAANALTSCRELDVCVIGEGEDTIVELARLVLSDSDYKSIDGISYLKDEVVVQNKRRTRIKNIDNIELPTWKGFPLENYLDRGYAMTTINRRAMPIIASRGCPFKCTFCSSPQMWGNELYLRSPQSIVNEIKKYKNEFNIEHIDFLDIVGVLKRSWIKELLELMIKEDLQVTWMYGAGTRSEILDPEILDLFKKSNTLRVFYAPESGSKSTIKKIKKKVDLDKMQTSMKYAHSLGISMRAPLIYGFPDQTLYEAFENVIFSFKLAWIGVDDVVAHSFSAYPGTELYNSLVLSGKINDKKLIADNEYSNFFQNERVTRTSNLKSWSEDIPHWMMPVFQTGVMGLTYLLSFIRHPKKFINTINRVFIQKKPLTLLDHVLFSKFVSRRRDISPTDSYEYNYESERAGRLTNKHTAA